MNVRRAVGIDLGTTNSAISMMTRAGNDIVLFEDRFKRKTLPSMVGWDVGAEAFVTGWEAWNRRVMEPFPVASIKRKMGTQQRVEVGPHALLPEEVSAKILERLAGEMRAHLAQRSREEDGPEWSITQAVITVPAYFDAPQIEATRRAGELAGLEVVSLLQEPTSAAMYYAWKHGIGDGTFLVYDLGGGTFDVSIIRCLMGEYQVLGIDGDNFLGGDDIDRRLAEYFRQQLVERGYALDLDVAGNPDDRTRFELLKRLAQETKEALSTAEFQFVGRTNLFMDQEGNSVSLELEISREQFEGLIRGLVEQSIEACERALARSVESADVGLTEIDHVLLVGGSTRVPLVQRLVAERLCGEGKSRGARPLIDEPDTCVALGAAIHAANVAGLTLTDDETIPSSPSEITITSTLTTADAEGRLVGRFRSPNASVIESVVLLHPAGDIAALVRPERDGDELVFAVEDIALDDPGAHPFQLELCDEEGDALASFPVVMVRLGHGETLRSTGSALSNPSVLAKDLYLEVVRDGRPDRQILLPSGSSLPAEGKFRFYTADRSGAVILRLFQNRFPIKTIHLSVPRDTEIGTPVDLNLTVDEAMTMVAGGELLGQSFWAQIEPPPARELKGWDEIEALLGKVDAIARELWGNEARYFRERTDRLVSGIREAARTDPDKLQVLVSRLEEAVEDYHSRDKELTPGYGRYTALLDAIKRVVYRQGDEAPKLGMSFDEWRERLSTIEQQAEAAYASHDQPSWSRLFNQVQAIWESLAQDEFRFIKSDPAEYVKRLRMSLLEQLVEARSLLDGFDYSGNPETRQLQQEEVERLRRELRERVEQPLQQLSADAPAAHAKHDLDRIVESLNYFHRQLDKLPTLGLVRH